MVRSSKSFVFNQRVEFFLVGIQILNADAVYRIFFRGYSMNVRILNRLLRKDLAFTRFRRN